MPLTGVAKLAKGLAKPGDRAAEPTQTSARPLRRARRLGLARLGRTRLKLSCNIGLHRPWIMPDAAQAALQHGKELRAAPKARHRRGQQRINAGRRFGARNAPGHPAQPAMDMRCMRMWW